MTRDDLYGHYRRFYVPNNATLVVVGDVDTDDALARVEHHFGAIPSGSASTRSAMRRAARSRPSGACTFARQGTTAYWRAAFHAPAFGDPDFFPMLFLDAALTGASGLNIWSGHKVPTPQRSARLYRAVVDTGLASSVGGALLPTEHPFLYYLWATVADGQTLPRVEDVDAGRARSRRARGHHRSRADARSARSSGRGSSTTATASPTSRTSSATSRRSAPGAPISELIPRLAHVTLDQVNAAARRYLSRTTERLGWFEPESSSVQVQDAVIRCHASALS